MSRIIRRDVERLELGEGDWVDVYLRLTYGDRAAIEERLLGPRVAGDGKITLDALEAAGVHLREGNIELLVRSIVAWGGAGFCELEAHPHSGACQIYPITEANIAQLDATAERILNFLREGSRPRATPDFTKPLSPDTSTDGAAEVATSAGAPSSSPSAVATDGASAS